MGEGVIYHHLFKLNCQIPVQLVEGPVGEVEPEIPPFCNKGGPAGPDKLPLLPVVEEDIPVLSPLPLLDEEVPIPQFLGNSPALEGKFCLLLLYLF